MSFLNGVMLLGTLALSIPIIIHLLNRSRFRVVQWGAMHLLAPVVRTNRKRVQIEQIILLMIRALIPLLLALVMARPVLTNLHVLIDYIALPILVLLCIGAATLMPRVRWLLVAIAVVGVAYVIMSIFGKSLVEDKPISTLARDTKTSAAIVLDNSYSMEAGGATADHLTAAKQRAETIIATLPRGSEVAVRLSAGGMITSAHASTVNLSRAAGDVVDLKPGFGASHMPKAMDDAAQALSRMTHSAKRELVIVSDFQAIDWQGENAPGMARVAELVKSINPKPSVTFFKVGNVIDNNAAVMSIDLSRHVVGVGQSVTIRGNLRNFGKTAYPSQRVHLFVDDKDVAMQEVNLDANKEAQVLFQYTFEKAGSHVIDVVSDLDALRADNRLRVVVPVWDKLPVLLVNGSPDPRPLKGETDFIAIALQPFGAAKETLADLIETSVVEAASFNAESLNNKRVIVLANVPRLSDEQIKLLDGFVADGNAALIFAGNRIDASWYNSVLYSEGKGILPARLGSARGEVAGSDEHAAVLAQRYDHPALELFNDPRNGNLADGEVRSWYKIDEPDPLPQGVVVAARLDTGDALFVEKPYGRGRVMLCATACDDEWSNLPIRPFFLPLTQRLVTHLAASADPPRNVDVGNELIAFVPASSVGRKATVRAPEGLPVEVDIEERGQRGIIKYSNTDRPGIYVIEPPGGAAIQFAVHTSRSESDLTPLNDEQLAAAAKPFDAGVVKTIEDYQSLVSVRAQGRPLWNYFYWGMLGLLFAELLLEQFFARKRI